MKPSRLTSWALCLTMGCAMAQWQPTAQVEYIVPAGPGGAVDTYARSMRLAFDETGALHGQNFIVSNRPGGDGLIALNPLAQQPGNAHLMTLLSSGYMLRQAQGNFKYDLTRDFTMGPILFEEVLGVAVRADSPWRSAADLVARLREDPGALRIAVAPYLYNHIHIGILQPLHAAGIATDKLTVAPFRSSAESVTALYGDHVDVVSASVGNLAAGVKGGMLRILAIASERRLEGELSFVPTWREQGIDGVLTSVQGVLFPHGLTEDQRTFWDARFQALSQSPQWRATLARYDVTPRYMDHREAEQFIREQLDRNQALMRELGLLQ